MVDYNKNLLGREAEGGALEISLSFDGWSPGGTTSDLVIDGVYEAMVMSCQPKVNKRGDGMNAMVVLKITGPKCSETGKQLVAYHPIPTGDLNSAENQKRRFLNNLLWSCACASRGDAAAEGFKTAGVRNITLGWFEGKKCYVKVRETTDQNGRPVGEIQFYQSKAQYEANPGPFGASAADPTDLAKSAQAAIDNPAKTETTAEAAKPAAPPANGGGGKNPVEDILGI